MLRNPLQLIDGLRWGVAVDSQAKGMTAIGWSGVDDALGGGLACGLHEWFGIALNDSHFVTRSLPIEIPVQLARRVQQKCDGMSWAVFVGRRCFPYPQLLVEAQCQNHRLFDQSIFVDAETPSDRLWSIEKAIDSPIVGVVLADGSRFNMAATRRVQLQSQVRRKFVFVTRPPAEMSELSAAQTRWLIQYERTKFISRDLFVNPRWKVKLLRCKGMCLPMQQDVWFLERDRATRTLRLSSEVAHTAIADQTSRQTA